MISDNLWVGQKVRLTGFNKGDAKTVSRWTDDAGFLRLFDAVAARPRNEDEVLKWFEDWQKNDRSVFFAVRPLETEQLLVVVSL